MTRLYRIPQPDPRPLAERRKAEHQRYLERTLSAKPASDFPENDWLTEHETVKYVAERMNCEWHEAEPALERACWDGKVQTDFRGGGHRMAVRVYFRLSIDDWLGLAPKTAKPGREQCGQWLKQIMESGSQTETKPWYLKEAQRKFGVSSYGFTVEWSGALKFARDDTWGKPGRRKAL